MEAAALKVIARFFPFLKPHYKHGLGISLLLLASTLLTVGTPFVYREMVDNGILKGNVPYLVKMLMVILAAMVFQEVLYLLRTRLILKVRSRLFTALRMDLYKHLMKMPQSFFSENHKGRLLSRMTWDVDAVQNLLLEQYIYFAHNLLVGCLICVVIFAINGQMILAAALFLPLLYVLFRLFKNKISGLSRSAQEKQEALTERLQEDLSMVKAIQSFSVLEERMGQTYRILQDTEDTKKKLSMRYSAASSSTTVINLVGLCIIWGMGGTEVAAGRMTIGTLIAISFYLNYGVNLFFSAYYTVMGFQGSLPAAERIFEVLDAYPDIADAPDAAELPELRESIALKNVTFAYNNDSPIFSGVSFTLDKGEWIGVAGESGQGKTTLANLLLRFYDPVGGRIEFGGADIRKVKLESLRKAVAIVPQEDHLFNLSIRENIVMGRKNITEEQFRKACEAARAAPFAEDFAEGYDTQIGENGMRLSAGQRKRISIARALLENPYLLIFDEATSVLDEKNERDVIESIHQLAENRIVMMISHKPSVFRSADKFLHIHDGAVDVYRTFAELEGKMWKNVEK
jgi:subfamily B ATP-binding cassette protein MsbA